VRHDGGAGVVQPPATSATSATSAAHHHRRGARNVLSLPPTMLTALRGVRVLDLTRILAGPYGTLVLGDLGAEVIKLERPGTGDEIRQVGPHFVAGESVYFMAVNRGKKSICVDLARDEGRAVLHDLVSRCDVLVENFRHGVAPRLGCDEATLRAINPRIIVCGITAFGRTGPDRDQPAFDLTIQARGGTMGITGEPGRLPVRMGPPMGDLAGGLFAAIAIAAALYDRERTGRGTFIDLGLLDCQVALLAYAAGFYLNAGDVLGPQGSAHAHAVPYQAFPTADTPVAIAVFTERFWAGFCRALDRPAWIDDPRFATNAARRAHRAELVDAITAQLATRPARAWLDALYAEQVPAAPVQSIDQVFADPQILARGMIAEMAHPTAGAVRTAANPIRMAEGGDQAPYAPPSDSGGGASHAAPYAPPPVLGQHTDEVLREVAGYDAARIAELRARGIVA
jgi:crotonobetainyl-CoA:carnitine CoA-transferase CaiB-like acyl-CoA transferase